MPSPDGIILGFDPGGKNLRWWLVISLTLLLLLAACEGSPTPTPTPAPTSTAVPTATPVPTATSAPSPTPAAATASGSGLMEKLSLIPADFKERGVWYGDRGRALEMAGLQPPRSREDLAQSDAVRDAYSDAGRGIYMAPAFLGGVYSNPEWEEVFGFNGYEVALALSFGDTIYHPLLPTYLEGDFDDAAIRQKLQDLGYEEIEASGQTYFSIRGDYAWDLGGPGGFAGGDMNRVYVSGTALIASPATEYVTSMLATWANESPSLVDDAAFSSIALTLGDPLSAGLLTGESVLNPEGGAAVDLSQFEKPVEWGTLHEWSDMGAGYGRDAEGEWWVLTLFYSDQDAADADADELIERMQGYDTALPELVERGWLQNPIDQSCGRLTAETRQHESGSTLSIRCEMTEEGTTALNIVDFGDLAFLLP